MERTALSVFEDKAIRRVWHNEEWWFSVVDVIRALTDSENPRNYWNMLKSREAEQGVELYTNCVQLKVPAPDGKLRETDCANTEGLFRIIQSIPSKKAEPFKLWLAKVGYERVQEIQDPELAIAHMAATYRAKGYSEGWIERRLQTVAARQELTDEWRSRGVDERVEFAILTNEITKAAFGKTVEEYKVHKGLQRENLRDHMSSLELLFTQLGEEVTTEITRSKDARGFGENQQAAREDGDVAGNARKDTKEAHRPSRREPRELPHESPRSASGWCDDEEPFTVCVSSPGSA